MSKELFSGAVAAGLVAQALASLIVAAPAQAQTAPRMALGKAATPPAGYLDFCARRPDQCGLTGATDAQGQPLSGEALARALYAQYYWPVALGGAAKTSVIIPASDGAPYDQVTQTQALQGPVASADAEPTLPALAIDADLAKAFAIRPIAADADHYALASLTFTFEDRSAPIAVPQTYSVDFARGLRLSLAQERGAKPAPVAAAQRSAGYDTPAGAIAEPSAPRPLAADRNLMAELDRVNLMVNRAIRFQLDKTLYGREDYWHTSLEPGGPRAGDCKDYVVEKRRALIADGVPAQALSIAIVRTGWNEPHAVLLVDTDQGEMVLDSLSSWIRPWWKVHYKWIERQAPGRQLDWVSLL